MTHFQQFQWEVILSLVFNETQLVIQLISNFFNFLYSLTMVLTEVNQEAQTTSQLFDIRKILTLDLENCTDEGEHQHNFFTLTFQNIAFFDHQHKPKPFTLLDYLLQNHWHKHNSIWLLVQEQSWIKDYFFLIGLHQTWNCSWLISIVINSIILGLS